MTDPKPKNGGEMAVENKCGDDGSHIPGYRELEELTSRMARIAAENGHTVIVSVVCADAKSPQGTRSLMLHFGSFSRLQCAIENVLANIVKDARAKCPKPTTFETVTEARA